VRGEKPIFAEPYKIETGVKLRVTSGRHVTVSRAAFSRFSQARMGCLMFCCPHFLPFAEACPYSKL
jgi:hypothetical protein